MILLFFKTAPWETFKIAPLFTFTSDFSIIELLLELPSIVISVSVAVLFAGTEKTKSLKLSPLIIFAFVPANETSPSISVVPITTILLRFWLAVASCLAFSKVLTALASLLPSSASFPMRPFR